MESKFVSLPSIDLEDAPRVTPAIDRVTFLQVGASRHLIIGTEKAAMNSAILIGKVAEHTTGREMSNASIWLEVSRPKVILVFGRRGSGKSYDLGVIVEGLTSQDSEICVRRGKRTPPVVIFDPLNQFWTLSEPPNPSDEDEKSQLLLLTKWGLRPGHLTNVKIFVPKGTPARHPMASEFSLDVSTMEIDDWCGLFQVDKYTDPIGQLLNSALRKVTQGGYQAGGRGVGAKAAPCIEDIVQCIQSDDEINHPQSGFHRQTIRAVISRFVELETMPLFTGGGVDIRAVFVEGQISVFMLREVDEGTRSVVVGQVIKKIMKARGLRWENEEVAKRLNREAELRRASELADAAAFEAKAQALLQESAEQGIPPGWVVLDEAHVLCPAEGLSASKSILIEYVKQGRAMGLSLAAATQQPSALSPKLISQRDLILVHHLGIKSDMEAALSQMNPNFPDAIIEGRERITDGVPYILLNRLKRGQVIISSDEASRNFLAVVRPRVTSHGGKEPVFI